MAKNKEEKKQKKIDELKKLIAEISEINLEDFEKNFFENEENNKDKKSNKSEKTKGHFALELAYNLEKHILELEKGLQDLEEKRMMLLADNQNTVNRFNKDAVNLRKYGGERLALEILPAIETFRKVLEAPAPSPDVQNYLVGFNMIINQIDQALTSSGISKINTKVGDDFSPEIHTAVEQVSHENYTTGQITSVIADGYKLHDKIIKHANVKVAK